MESVANRAPARNCRIGKTFALSTSAPFCYTSPAMQNAHAPAVAVVAERASAYGRGFIRGIADFAAAHDDWNM